MGIKYTHFDQQENAIMVDVSEKSPTMRTAIAEEEIRVNQEIIQEVSHKQVAKGDVLEALAVVDRLSPGISEAKRFYIEEKNI